MISTPRTITLPGPEAAPLFLCGPGSSSLDAAWEFFGQKRLPVWGSVLMESQSAGRGRFGRPWQSPPGHVYGALRLPLAPPFDEAGASLATAFVLIEALAEFGWALDLKWPNDLIWRGAKVGGLLLESGKGALLAGLGLNLKAPPPGEWRLQRDPGAPPPGALPFAGPPEALWAALVKKIILLYNEKFRSQSMADLAGQAEKKLLWRGRLVRVERPASEPPAPQGLGVGRIVGLGPEGYLRLAVGPLEYRLCSGRISLAEGDDSIDDETTI